MGGGGYSLTPIFYHTNYIFFFSPINVRNKITETPKGAHKRCWQPQDECDGWGSVWLCVSDVCVSLQVWNVPIG